jgi:hypothetical protein
VNVDFSTILSMLGGQGQTGSFSPTSGAGLGQLLARLLGGNVGAGKAGVDASPMQSDPFASKIPLQGPGSDAGLARPPGGSGASPQDDSYGLVSRFGKYDTMPFGNSAISRFLGSLY